MALHGELIEWNDERGFGFIRPDGTHERLFVHISQMPRGATRPELGDRVSYAVGRGRDGGPAAFKVVGVGSRNAKSRGPSRATRSPARRYYPVRLVVAVGITMLALVGTVMGSVPLLLLIAYGVMGAAAAAFYYNDKRRAETGGWRISEASLHGMDLAFGIVGGLVAQQLIRHKTAKRGFALLTYAIAALHGLLLVALVSGCLSLAGFIPG
jgi:uncharacterized membrane protein YsdA (DUF1294 family)/cold shock CspA family protein